MADDELHKMSCYAQDGGRCICKPPQAPEAPEGCACRPGMWGMAAYNLGAEPGWIFQSPPEGCPKHGHVMWQGEEPEAVDGVSD